MKLCIGHYIAWVKRNDTAWIKYDDDKVSVVSPEEITKLDGGGRLFSSFKRFVNFER